MENDEVRFDMKARKRDFVKEKGTKDGHLLKRAAESAEKLVGMKVFPHEEKVKAKYMKMRD